MVNLQDLLRFRGEALTQFILVATIFGAFSMSGVIALIASHEKARLRSALFILLALASLAFVFATLLSVLILPFMGSNIQLNDQAVRGLLFLYALVVLTIVIGTVLLTAGIAGVGFMVSPRTGQCTLWSTIIASVAFLLCVFHLANILR
jgi:hypothetical protein